MRPGSDIATGWTPWPQVPYRGQELTHEQFCHRVRDLAVSRLTDDAPKARLLAAKLVYGVGDGSYHGICYFSAWENGTRHDLIEIAATGERSAVQLAGTTIHEVGHVLAGRHAGHEKEWHDACFALGLRDIAAVGAVAGPDAFAPDLWAQIHALGEPMDGTPYFATLGGPGPFVGLPPIKIRPCPMGKGTRGGRTIQTTRMRLYHCACLPPVKVRAATDTLAAHCDKCRSPFERVLEGDYRRVAE